MFRSPDILKFYINNSALDNEHLDMIWNTTRGKHESIVGHVHDIIVTIGQSLNAKSLMYLFEKMRSSYKYVVPL